LSKSRPIRSTIGVLGPVRCGDRVRMVEGPMMGAECDAYVLTGLEDPHEGAERAVGKCGAERVVVHDVLAV